MESRALGPWIPPVEPPLARLALEAADQDGIAAPGPWPEVRGNGVAFRGLPTFLCWRGIEGGTQHLVLLQARELGAPVAGARKPSLPPRWLDALDLAALALPLRRHPDFPGGAELHVVQVLAPGEARVRSAGEPAPALIEAVLARLTGIAAWRVADASYS